MPIQYIEPLFRAISRTKKALFDPFHLQKWFVVGFTAFLAGVAELGYSGGPSLGWRSRADRADMEGFLNIPKRSWEWLMIHPGWTVLIIFVLFLLLVLGILITWISSRGKFMFLDNVVHDRMQVAAPWYEYRREGNSFFIWNLSWRLIVLAAVVAYAAFSFFSLQRLHQESQSGTELMIPAILLGLGLLLIITVGAFIYLLLRDFVVAVMYRDRVSAGTALRKLAPVFTSSPLHFIGYGLFRVCLSLLIVAGVAIAGCVTCCLGFVILAIPYINAVVLLPLSYALRSFSVEFLEQFGSEFSIFPRPDAIPPGINTEIV